MRKNTSAWLKEWSGSNSQRRKKLHFLAWKTFATWWCIPQLGVRWKSQWRATKYRHWLSQRNLKSLTLWRLKLSSKLMSMRPKRKKCTSRTLKKNMTSYWNHTWKKRGLRKTRKRSIWKQSDFTKTKKRSSKKCVNIGGKSLVKSQLSTRMKKKNFSRSTGFSSCTNGRSWSKWSSACWNRKQKKTRTGRDLGSGWYSWLKEVWLNACSRCLTASVSLSASE